MGVKWKKEILGGVEYEYLPITEFLVKAKGVCGTRPTVKYTRIPVSLVYNLLKSGRSVDSLYEDYRQKIPKEALLEIKEFQENYSYSVKNLYQFFKKEKSNGL